jgi:DNA polymerase-3 subunit epsilon
VTVPPLRSHYLALNPLSRVAQCLMADWLYARPTVEEGAAFVLPPKAPQTQTPSPLKALAFIDLETTGQEPTWHDILEVAVVRVDASTLKVLGQYNALVAPGRLEYARPEALEACGFSKAAWAKAVPLKEALEAAAPLLEGAHLAGHDVDLDWGFLEAGYLRAGLRPPRVEPRRLDTASLAWPLFVGGEVPSVSLDDLAAHFGLSRCKPHRALSDALCALEVARRLAARMQRVGRRLPEALFELAEDEDEEEEDDDGGAEPCCESCGEAMDGLCGVEAPLGKQRQAEQRRRRRVYVCHPFSDDVEGNIEAVRDISRQLLDEGVFPVAPHLYLPQLLDESTERERALGVCLEMLDTCDEVRAFGGRVTAGMKRELEHAMARGLPVHFVREVA